VSPGRPGYTLVELMLVLALMVMVAAIAYPSLDTMYLDTKLSMAGDQVRAKWLTARTQSVNEGRPYRFAVILGKGNYRLAPDSADFWGGSNGQTSDPDNGPLILEEALPKGVIFNTPDSGQSEPDPNSDTGSPTDGVDWSRAFTVATFLPDGTTREDLASITFNARGARPVDIKLRGLTGAITVKQRSLEDNHP
jgi:prepilin-type N-terminal cleavage/methylation domain-containing protein